MCAAAAGDPDRPGDRAWRRGSTRHTACSESSPRTRRPCRGSSRPARRPHRTSPSPSGRPAGFVSNSASRAFGDRVVVARQRSSHCPPRRHDGDGLLRPVRDDCARRQASSGIVRPRVQGFGNEPESRQRARETKNAAAKPRVAGGRGAQLCQVIERDVLELRTLDNEQDLTEREVEGFARWLRGVSPVHHRPHDAVERVLDPWPSEHAIREGDAPVLAERLEGDRAFEQEGDGEKRGPRGPIGGGFD